MSYKKVSQQKAIEKEKEMVEMYCNNCNTIHRINAGNLIVGVPQCNKCNHNLCNCEACKSTISLIKRGVLNS